MRLSKEFKILVIIGAWNQNIFTKKWVEKFLLPHEDFKLETSVSIRSSHRVSSKMLRMEFHHDRINFIPIANEREAYKQISELAAKISDYLPHTPVAAYGVNFLFECGHDEIQDELIRINDIEKLKNHGVDILESQHRHTLRHGSIPIPINIGFTKKQANLDVEFNFHSTIESLTELKEKLYEIPIDGCYQVALDILDNVYNIRLSRD